MIRRFMQSRCRVDIATLYCFAQLDVKSWGRQGRGREVYAGEVRAFGPNGQARPHPYDGGFSQPDEEVTFIGE